VMYCKDMQLMANNYYIVLPQCNHLLLLIICV
jgi:hypothetical protein